MPAFEGSLTRDQIWQIITYMRSGFPPLDGSDAD
jgi:mono/diheme cytochrome c family protein